MSQIPNNNKYLRKCTTKPMKAHMLDGNVLSTLREHIEVFGPLCLLMGQHFATREVFKIPMVCEYLDGGHRTL
jgi:hypothetical protein